MDQSILLILSAPKCINSAFNHFLKAMIFMDFFFLKWLISLTYSLCWPDYLFNISISNSIFNIINIYLLNIVLSWFLSSFLFQGKKLLLQLVTVNPFFHLVYVYIRYLIVFLFCCSFFFLSCEGKGVKGKSTSSVYEIMKLEKEIKFRQMSARD